MEGVGEAVSEYCVPVNNAPGRLVTQLIITPGILVYGFTVFSVNAATQYVLMFDGRDVPDSGAVPILSLDCQTNTLRGVSYTPNGRKFFEGLVLVTSSTPDTFTTNATADVLFDVQFDFVAG